MSGPVSLSRVPLGVSIASVVLGPTVWLFSMFIGLVVDSSTVVFAIVAVFYAFGFMLACYGLLGIPRVGTRGVLVVGLVGGVLNGFLFTAAIVALLIFRFTYA